MTRTVNVVDTVVPVITIWGVSPVTVEVGLVMLMMVLLLGMFMMVV